MELDQRAENQKKVLLDEKTKHRIKTQQTIWKSYIVKSFFIPWKGQT